MFIGYSLTDYTFNNIYYELQEELGGYLRRSYSVSPLYSEKKIYLESVLKKRRIELIDEKFDTFMLILSDEFNLLDNPKVMKVIVQELSREGVIEKLGSIYINRLPEVLRIELEKEKLI